LNRILHSRMLLDPTMFRDVTSSVAEFMVRVLHSRMLLDPASVRFQRACVWPIAYLSGAHFLTG
jgi:hypothetical protein